ncbi:hypothetical protein [Prevotella pallens]|uniref:hypothetical protein n=1 Tax=Prevotella pallens TaxID=60133 RepID=UPI001CB2C20C|nr:hypothetical protein [Prevotella pallens]MBF1451868.1 hypothetical protein [Prevotella pallens]
MNNINKKERLERKGSISLSFKFDLQLFADKETLSGDPYLPDHKAQNDFIDDDTIPEVSTSRTRRNNPYTISHIDRKYKSWATYMMNIKLTDLNYWFSRMAITVIRGIQDWPGDGPRNDRWKFSPLYFQDQTGRSVLSAENQNKVMHYFDNIVYVSSADYFADALNLQSKGTTRSNESFISLATIERIVKNMNFMSCTSMQGMFFGTGGGIRGLPPVIEQTLTFENFTFTNGSRPNMDHMFEQSAFKGLVIKSNFVPGSMDYFLKDCKYLETVDLTSVATNMIALTKLRETFAGCSRLKEVKGTIYLDGLVWNAIDSNGTKFDTFKDCTALEKPVKFAGFNLSTFCRGNSTLYDYYWNKYKNAGGVNQVQAAMLSEILNIPVSKVSIQ